VYPLRWILSLTALIVVSPYAGAQGQSTDSPAAKGSPHKSLINQYCVGCHNQKSNTGGVALETPDLANVGANADIWERVLRKIRTGEMPPPGLPRPKAEAAAAFASGLESALDKAAAAQPNPGRPAVHRLNRAEYSNAIRDLLALDVKPGSWLPVDDSGYGFDNIADVLSMSPALLERYMSAARRISSLAVGDLKMKPAEEQFQPLRDPPSNFRRPSRIERVSGDLPFNSRGGLSFEHYFPLDAEYAFRIKVTGQNPQDYELRVPVKAGLRTVGVTFLRESPKAELEAPGGRGAPQYGGPPPLGPPAEMDLRLDGAKLQRFQVEQRLGGRTDVNTVTIGGPYNATGRGVTPSRARIFVCRPATTQEEEPCARTILSTLTRRAFRRPVAETDIRPLLACTRRAALRRARKFLMRDQAW
jgi:mono/diheme cytochrome c family protein